MATPLSADAMLSALRAEGVNVRENTGWRTHNRNHKGAWGPVEGVVIHHTAGRDSLRFCIDGNASLPGPLCHAHLAKNGTLTVIANGRANHAGSFAANAHNAVLNASSTHPLPAATEPIDGNRHYYGIEVENLGNGTDQYPAEQYDQTVRWAAAICRAHGWSAQRVIGHKEGTRRKIDPHGPVAGRGDFDMNTFRADVAARLRRGAVPAPTPTPEVPDMPNHLYFERKDPVTLTPGTWYTVTWDRVWAPGKGWNDRSRVQTLLSGEHLFSLDVGARFEGTTRDANGEHVSGLAHGQEVQVRVGRNSRPKGGEWKRAKSWSIDSPVHDAGGLHVAHHWQGHLPGSDDNRLVVDILIPGGGRPVKLDGLVASLFAWPL